MYPVIVYSHPSGGKSNFSWGLCSQTQDSENSRSVFLYSNDPKSETLIPREDKIIKPIFLSHSIRPPSHAKVKQVLTENATNDLVTNINLAGCPYQITIPSLKENTIIPIDMSFQSFKLLQYGLTRIIYQENEDDDDINYEEEDDDESKTDIYCYPILCLQILDNF